METKQYRLKHTVYGLKEDPQQPTLAPAVVDLDSDTAARLLSTNAIEEIAGEDLLAQANEAEQQAEKLRQQASQKKAKAELIDRINAVATLPELDALGVIPGNDDPEVLEAWSAKKAALPPHAE